ncbi:AAA family ATPase [Nisaea nitritireducens]|uniref:AAA family ATPase n=1 Tax=Nisaea nitritireducens TaxID=568392 RepID=UPI001865C0FD|nr:ATP-binding protein [Nisaea nitritireducens]
MANTKQILAMLKSRAAGDDELFYSIALQVAAAEARQGRRTTAEDIRAAVDEARAASGSGPSVPISIAKPRGDLQGLIELREPKIGLRDVVLEEGTKSRLNDVIRQQTKRDWLREHGKTPSRRLLFVGPPGSGKTMTGEALAHSLRLPLLVVRLETLITRFMGETAAKLRLVFDELNQRRGVYLFDEFDALGGRRDATNDVAEMRRVLNSFLQFMEESNTTDSLVVAATNHPEILDRALLRRFDLILEFDLPTPNQIRDVVKRNIRPLKLNRPGWKSIESAASGLSQSEIARATEDAAKMAILEERNSISTTDLIFNLTNRSKMQKIFSSQIPRH